MTSQPTTILLVEDDENDYLFIKRLFDELPEGTYHLDRVADYASVLHAFEHCVHDLYLIDYRLGEHTGIDILNEARRRECMTPMIMLTEQHDREIDLQAMRAGAVDYLVKEQLDVHRLERSMRYALQHRRQQQAVEETRQQLEQRVEQRTAELRLSRERLDLVVNATEIGLWFRDLPGDALQWNSICKMQFGLPLNAEVTSDLFFDRVHADDRRRVIEAVERTLSTGVDYDIVYRVRIPGDGERWIRAIGRRFCNEAGTPTRFDGVTIDVTAQKQGERNLADSQRFLHSVLEALPSQIAVLDETGKIVAVNEAWNRFAQLNGLPDEGRAVGQNYLEACASSSPECSPGLNVADCIREVIAGTRMEFQSEYFCQTAKKPHWFQMRVTPFRSLGPVRVVVAHDDITERVQSEQSLRRRSSQLQELAEISARLNEAHDVNTVLDTLNQGARAIIGAHQAVTNHKVGASWLQALNFISVSDKYAAWRDFNPCVDGSGICSLVCETSRAMRLTQAQLEEHPGWHEFGVKRSLYPPMRGWLAAPLVGREGRNLGLVQLSDRYEGEFTEEDEAILIQLAQMASVAIENAFLYRDLREVDQRKDQFLATLAHELRNPLSPLTSAAQLIAMDPANTEQVKELTAMISRQLDQLRRLIDDLLDVSRISSGKMMLRREPVALTEAVSAAIDVSRSLFESAGHQLTVIAADCPLVIYGDKVRLSQIVGNLLINAAKYTPPGGKITLETRVEAGSAVVVISDNGIGIAREMLQRIFGLFTQIDSSNTRAQGGLGIGLTLAKTLVEMHGGTLHAASPGPAQGSTFTVRLPLADPAIVIDKTPVPETEIVLPTFRVLIVDDNRSAAHLLSRLLQKVEQRVNVAHSAAEALEQLEKFEPDVLISDIAMPGESGYELATQVCSMSLTRKPVLVALTGYGQESDRQQALASGFDHHLTKPIGLPALKQLLKRITERRR